MVMIVMLNFLVYFIRIAAANANDFFTRIHEKLQDLAIEQTLRIDTIISDFNPNNEPQDDSDSLKTAAAGFSIADKLIKQVPVVGSIIGDLMGIGGAIMSILAANQLTDEGVDLAALKTSVENNLADFFRNSNDQFAKFCSKLFGGDDDIKIEDVISTIQGIRGISGNSALNPIAQLFSGGAFLNPASSAHLDDAINDGFNTVKQNLVGTVIKTIGYYVFVDTNRNSDACGGIVGARWINDVCIP
jgi:hypothetical protein